MESLFIYLLKVNALLLLFWAFYALFLKNESFYTLNRWYFIISILVSFISPSIWFTNIIYIEQEVYETTPQNNYYTEINTVNLDNVDPNYNFFENINWMDTFFYLISIISIGLVLILIVKICRLYYTVKNLPKYNSNSIKISPENNTVFSFYKWIVISSDVLKKPELDLIIEHEKIHIQQNHTFDLVLIEFIRKIFWFNPLIKLIQQNITLNLEFIVDEKVSEKFDRKTYQFSLIKSQINHQPNLIVSSFKTNDIKKRIVQLNNQKSKNMKKLKFLITIPALSAFFILFQVNTIANTMYKTIGKENLFDTKENSAYQIKIDTIKKEVLSNNKNVESKEIATNRSSVKTDTIKIKNYTIVSSTSVQKTNPNFNQIENYILDITKQTDLKSAKIALAKKHMLFFVDGKQVDNIFNVDAKDVDYLVFKEGKFAVKEFGDKAKDGVINVITIYGSVADETKKNNNTIDYSSVAVVNEKPAGVSTFFHTNNIKFKNGITLDNKQVNTDSDNKTFSSKMSINNMLNSYEDLKSKAEFNRQYEENLFREGKLRTNISESNSGNTKTYMVLDLNNPNNKNIKIVYVVDGKVIKNPKKLDIQNLKFIQFVQGEEIIKKYGKKATSGAVFLSTN